MSQSNSTKIDNRSQLIYALSEVAELEHVLMCQYLFAAFSLKTDREEFSNEDRRYHQVEMVRRWKKLLLQVAREEMQHLAFAMNLLVSVGGAPTFTRSNFPCANRFFRTGPNDTGIEMSLERFGIEAINRFIRFETNDPKADQERAMMATGIPDPNYYETLPEFYRAVKDGFTKEMFVPLGTQYDPLDEGGGSVRIRRQRNVPNTVATVEQAHTLIDLIVLHGEGATASDPDAHWHIFRQIRDELQEELKIDPNFVPAREVVSNPLSRFHDDIRPDVKAPYTVLPKDRDGGLQHNSLQLFNAAYEVLLNWLFQLFTRQGNREELRAIETIAFLPYMSEVIRPLGEFLTLVPVNIGSQPTLGPSFEVTSNNFLTPSAAVTARLTTEKLSELVNRAEQVAKSLRKHKLTTAAAEFAPILKTLRILKEEFDSRLQKGWPPRPSPDPTNPDNQFSETAARMWISGGPPLIELEFQGWTQIRLATDPDGGLVRRGCTGNAFAIGDEPDLDRIIRLQPERAIVRSHCPPIGVKVVGARLLSSPLQSDSAGQPIPQLVGAKVELLESPMFEGRNHLVSEDGEPIDPFVLQIRGAGGTVLRRRVIGPPINDMTPVQRRGSGRFPTNLQVSLEAMRENMRRAGLNHPLTEYLAERIQMLQADLDKIPSSEQIGRVAEELKFRISVLEDAKPGNIRWTRFFFDAEYAHTLSGPLTAKFSKFKPAFQILPPKKNDPAKWLINYHFGFFDTDALSAYMFGKVWIPVKLL